jgi:hypothetical protein
MADSLLACLGALALWGVLACLEVVLGSGSATPTAAFRRAAGSVFLAAGLFPAVIILALASGTGARPPPWPAFAFLLFALPPALLAGVVAASLA